MLVGHRGNEITLGNIQLLPEHTLSKLSLDDRRRTMTLSAHHLQIQKIIS